MQYCRLWIEGGMKRMISGYMHQVFCLFGVGLLLKCHECYQWVSGGSLFC
jgi:hypothetical protein